VLAEEDLEVEDDDLESDEPEEPLPELRDDPELGLE
jgi:hypothetical protein